jgi:hypothetical protein
MEGTYELVGLSLGVVLRTTGSSCLLLPAQHKTDTNNSMMSKEEESVVLVAVLNENIPIYYSQQIFSPETVEKAIGSKPFKEWVDNVELSRCMLRSMLHQHNFTFAP